MLRPGRGRTSPTSPTGRRCAFARAQVATLRAVFRHVCLLAEPGTLRGRRFGNLVAVASDVELPIATLTRRCAGDPMPPASSTGPTWTGSSGMPGRSTTPTPWPPPEPPPGVFSR